MKWAAQCAVHYRPLAAHVLHGSSPHSAYYREGAGVAISCGQSARHRVRTRAARPPRTADYGRGCDAALAKRGELKTDEGPQRVRRGAVYLCITRQVTVSRS